MGWPGIYSICFSQFDGDKDSLLLDGEFSFLIVVRLIRDNWKAVIENYPTSLISEIWFDLQDKQLLGIILLPLLVRFGLIYRISSYWEISFSLLVRFDLIHGIWALVLGLYLGDVIKVLLLVLSPLLLILCVGLRRVGLCAYFLNSISCPPTLGYGERGQGLYRFLDQARYPHGYLGRV